MTLPGHFGGGRDASVLWEAIFGLLALSVSYAMNKHNTTARAANMPSAVVAHRGGSGDVQARRRVVGSPQPRPPAARGGATAKPTLFLARLYEMVNDPKTDQAIQWTTTVSASPEPGASAFTITDNMLLEKHWLPKFYKHANFTSFVRQLNQYQFRKLEAKRWTFGHESFVRHRPELLVHISRKRKESDSGLGQQNNPKKAATGAASNGTDERESKLEAYVQQLSETLQRVVDQHVEMQLQLNDLSQRIGGASASHGAAIKRESAHTDGITPAGLPPSTPWSLLNQNASVVEFADIDIPTDTDIDSLLSPAKSFEDDEPQKVVPPPPPPQREELREHPLQLPRPSTLFQAGY